MSKPVDKRYSLKLAGEIRFGPQYFDLEINGKKIADYFYGFDRAEFENGRYLAIEEWLTTDYQKGPVTRVAIFDLDKGFVARLKVVEKGFVSEFRLNDGVFLYKKKFPAKGEAIETEVVWSAIKNWAPVSS